MSAPFVIPFNNCPVSVSVKTASYTVPAGKYALTYSSSPFFTVNGANLYPSGGLATTGGMSATSIGNVIGHLGYYVTACTVTRSGTGGSIAGSAGWGFGSVSGVSNYLSSITVPVSGAASFALTTGYAQGGNIWTQATGTNNSPVTISVSFLAYTGAMESWVPFGTVLNGSNYIVMEYNQIS
jgi:hypothetical protein